MGKAAPSSAGEIKINEVGKRTSMLRPAVNSLASYIAGRSARDAIREHGWSGPIAPLAANESPYGPFQSARVAIEKAIADANRYPESGFISLRGELAQRLGLPIDRVAVSSGGTAVIHHVAVAVLEAGDEVVLCSPTFHACGLEARKMGASVLQARLRSDGSYDLDAMLALITPRTRLAYVCNPNNPTGGIVNRADLLRFVRAVPANVVILVDEAYIEYADAVDFPDTMRDAAFHGPNLVTLRTFSKAYGLAGLRVGYAAGSPEIIDSITKIQSNYEVTSFSLAAARASLADDVELSRRISENKRERDLVSRTLADRGFSVMPSHANFVCVAVGAAKKVAKELESKGVIVRPLDAMGDPSSIRITIGTAEQNLQAIEALRILRNA